VSSPDSTDFRDRVGISVRNGSYNTVVGNAITGGGASEGSVIAFIDNNYGGDIVGNVVSGNTIKISDDASVVAIAFTAGGVDLRNNIVSDNVIVSKVRVNLGAINFAGRVGQTLSSSNKIIGNTITSLGGNYGIRIGDETASVVSDNYITVEQVGTGAEFTGVVFVGCDGCFAEKNKVYVQDGFGAQIPSLRRYRGFQGTANSVVLDNRVLSEGDATEVNDFIEAGSNTQYLHYGTVAPNITAAIGSTWYNTAGGAGTVLYIKESGTDNTGWVGK
jgi:hypothetical protein